MKKLISILLICIMSLGVAGCGKKGGNAVVKPSEDRLQVYTSFYAMYDFAREIAGEAADVHLMCPVGSEPHDYEPGTADIAKLSEADIFIYNGGGMEHWAQKIASTLDGVKVVCTSDGLIDEGATDPHIWLSPVKAQLQMERIYDALMDADPDNAETYTKNFGNQSEMLAELDIAYKEALADAALKTIVVGHGAYSYLCNEYSIEQIAIEGTSGESDPSPAAMAAVIDKAKAQGIKYVCAEEMNSSKVVEAAAKEIGAEVVTLNPFEGSADDKHYIEVMHENLATLVKVLG